VRFPELDTARASGLIEDFIRERTAEAGLGSVVVGISGGLDSAVAMTLAVRALGPAEVFAFSLPGQHTTAETCEDARALAQAHGVTFQVIEIAPQLDAYFDRFGDADRVRRGNKAARERMSILYDQAKAHDALVLGTSNKTELLLGYGTIHGDMAASMQPIMDMYKTEIRQLARFLGVPASICGRAPSAELWEGQTDEGELGLTYEEVDLLLWAMIDRGMDDEELLESGFTPALIDEVKLRIEANAFKRRLAPVCIVHQ
jgi:NAD+ synthase